MGKYDAAVDELLESTPRSENKKPSYSDVVDEILNPTETPERVGGTFQPKVAPFPGGTPPASAITGKPETQFVPGTEPDARFTTMMKAGLVDDPVTKVKIFAEGRGIPVSEIPGRYRIRDGKIEFKTNDGSWQREVSDVPLQRAIQAGAETLSHPSTYLGTAGAILGGAPGAVGGAMAGEIIRKGVGKAAYREPQTIGGNLLDVGLEGVLALGGEMVGKVISGTINKYMARKAKALRFAGQEIKQGLLSAKDHAKATYIKALADQHNIKLAPFQLYDKEGMTNVWKYLRKHPLTSNNVQKFETAIEEQSDIAIDDFIRKLGGYEETPTELGVKLKRASEGAITGAKEARKAAAKPYYEKALSKKEIIDTDKLAGEYALNQRAIEQRKPRTIVDVDTMVNELKTQSDVPTLKIKGESEASYADRISRDYKRITGKEPPTSVSETDLAEIQTLKDRNETISKILKGEAPPEGTTIPTKPLTVDISEATAEVDRLLLETVKGDPSYTALSRIKIMLQAAAGDPRKLDRVKRSGIDNVLNKTGTSRTMSRELKLVKDKLTSAMDTQIPDYATARAKYAELSRPVDRLRESVIGELSEMEGDKALSQSVRKLFSVTNMPDATILKEARKAIQSQDPDLWRRSVGGYIRDIYQDLIVTEEGKVANAVGKLQKRLFGSKRQRQVMAEAFGGANTKEFKAFEDLMTVFQRAALGASKESMTAPFQQIQQELVGGMGSSLYRAASTPKQWTVDKIFGWWNDTLLSGRQGDLLNALTAPNVQAQIARLRQLTPRSRRFWESFGVFTTLVGTKIEPPRLPETEEGQIALPQ